MKTVSFIYTSPDSVNLGRFGAVIKGTPLPLNAMEARDVAKDSRFKKSDKDLFPLVYQPGKISPNESDDESKERIKADIARGALYDRLNAAFDENEKPDKK